MGKTTKIAKQDASVSYTGNWGGLAGGNEVQLEDAGNVSNGSGTFGVATRQLADGSGAGAVGLIEGTDYNNDSRLDTTGGSDVDIYDDSASGSFATGKVLRIVEDGVNVANTSTGLGLQVYAKDLTTLISPPSTQVYVDPARGKFVLPRPNYYAKCTDWTNAITSPEIGQATKVNGGGGEYTTDIKFGNGIWGSFASTNLYTKINLSDNFSSFNTGTISLWYKHIQSNSSVDLKFADASQCRARVWSYILDRYKALNLSDIGGTNTGTIMDNTNIPAVGTVNHIYMVWDTSNNLTGGKSVRVFLNGTEILSTTDASLVPTGLFVIIYSVDGATSAGLSNIKTWNHVVTEDPSWEYNSGTGREDALHTIYGSANGYKPVLDSSSDPDSGVGYYYIASTTTPASLDETDASGASAKWNI